MSRCILFLAVCILASPLNAQEIVIGDFENGLDPGWQVEANSMGELVTNWSSSGTTSLRITPDLENTFNWSMRFDDLATVQMLSETHFLRFEVYWETSEWQTEPEGTEGFFIRWDTSALNSSFGWTQTNDALMCDPVVPDAPGTWDPFNYGASHERTLTYDFRTLEHDASESEWGVVHFSQNQGQVINSGWYYIDNVRLVPVDDVLLGDVNMDGVVDLLDVTPFVELLTAGGYLPEADINQDGVLDLLDVTPFVELLSGG